MHLFYRIDRVRWAALLPEQSKSALQSLEQICQENSNPSHPRVVTYLNVGGKADLAVMIYARNWPRPVRSIARWNSLFPPGALQQEYTYLSVTELPDYFTTEEEMRKTLLEEKLDPPPKLLPPGSKK